MKLYYCHIEEIDISYPETTNDLEEKSVDKPVDKPVDKAANKEILTPFDYLEFQKPY